MSRYWNRWGSVKWNEWNGWAGREIDENVKWNEWSGWAGIETEWECHMELNGSNLWACIETGEMVQWTWMVEMHTVHIHEPLKNSKNYTSHNFETLQVVSKRLVRLQTAPATQKGTYLTICLKHFAHSLVVAASNTLKRQWLEHFSEKTCKLHIFKGQPIKFHSTISAKSRKVDSNASKL